VSGDVILIASGIEPFDEQVGGLEQGGTYPLLGAPGPEKLVAALQFVDEGVRAGERCLFVTNSEIDSLLGVAEAWGFDLREAWETGRLQIVGFNQDFELRASRSIVPEEIIDELDGVKGPDLSRIAVDPGAMLLTSGAKMPLGSNYLARAREQDATVLTTLSIDSGATSLPSAAEWLINATTGCLLFGKQDDGLCQVTLSKAVPSADERVGTIPLELRSGVGWIRPERAAAPRGLDRVDVELILEAVQAWETAGRDDALATGPQRVLIVDDAEEARFMMRALLEKNGFEVEEAEDGHKALGMLTLNENYNLVVLDLSMPRPDGREVLQHIRSSFDTSALPVLIRSAADSDLAEAELLDAGADDDIEKDADEARFMARVNAAIRRAL